jgi:hypothetical protein
MQLESYTCRIQNAFFIQRHNFNCNFKRLHLMDTTSDSTNTSVLVRKLHERAEGFHLLTTTQLTSVVSHAKTLRSNLARYVKTNGPREYAAKIHHATGHGRVYAPWKRTRRSDRRRRDDGSADGPRKVRIHSGNLLRRSAPVDGRRRLAHRLLGHVMSSFGRLVPQHRSFR